LDDTTLVQAASKQAVNSDGTRKRNFQPGNKAVQVSTGNSSHAREISVVETKDSRSKFQKKSDVSCLHDSCSILGSTCINSPFL
jgi:plastocyanin domain-containing protein